MLTHLAWRRVVVVAMTTALVAGTAGEGASAVAASAPAPVHSQWQSPVQRAAAAAHSPADTPPAIDPEDEALLKQMQHDLVADIAGQDEDEEVRVAARETLKKMDAGDQNAATEFFDHGHPAAKAQAKKRKDEADAANRALIEPLAGLGGPAFNEAVDRALKGDARARENFLAYERDLATERDRKTGAYDKEIKSRRRMHAQVVADRGAPEVAAAAKAALAQGDAAIEEFLKTGYLAAAKRDADAREQHLKDLERQRKDAEAASDLAQRTARAMTARRNLLAAHTDGVRALERVANDMTAAANASRDAARTLASDQAGHSYHPELYQRAKDEVARQVGYATTDAQQAQAAAAGATAQANILVQNGMPHGAQWAKVVQGMAASAAAAKNAADTAAHAVDAVAADAAATDATEKAKAHAEYARQWRANAEAHAAAAQQLATAAQEQAVAAAQAAEQARLSHVDAVNALHNAQAHAANVKQARLDAERERDTAAAKRQEAEQWRAQAATKRAEAETAEREAARQRDIAVREGNVARQKRQEAEAQQRIAAQRRGDAQGQEQIAADAAKDARAQEKIASDADADARAQEQNADRARADASAVTKSAETAEKKAQVLEALATRAAGIVELSQADKDKARAAATQARTDANTAAAAARDARTAADAAGVAASRSRSAAIQATAAAGRSRAAADRAQAAASQARAAANQAEAAAENARSAANEAQVAAARANQAANRAEAEAAAVHAEAVKADAAAAEATAAEARAADNARKAADLAQQAAVESASALGAAQRTQDEANAASVEAATAATQAGIATRAANAAVQSASGIANPADIAIGLASPFAATDIDADFAVIVAGRARDTGNDQVIIAQTAATDAAAQARKAAEAAKNASGEVPLAFQAAAAAANSAAEAANSAAAAQQSAAQAAIEAAGARQAAAEANAVDVLAQADARGARAAADQAAADAALAGLAADQAEADARAARVAADNATRAANQATAAADRAERDAAAAQRAAEQAEKDAADARAAAERAQAHADDAARSATNAEDYAKDAEGRANNAEADAKDIQAQLAQMQEELRLENEARQRQEVEEALNDDSDVPALTAEETDALRTEKGQTGVDEYNAARDKANRGLKGFIVEQGGQVLLDLIGFTDAKKCFTEGDFIACVMTVLNALPFLKFLSVISKIPDAISTTVRVVKGIRSFKDAVVVARRVTTNLRNMVRELIKCRQPGNSFTPDTPVLLADHSRKAIKDIVVGDLVLATDPTSGQSEAKPVTAVIVGSGEKHLVDLRTRSEDGDDGTVTATDGHPFWLANEQKWVDARDLHPGDQLRTDHGDPVTITATATRTETLTVYNLTVADIHTYYVITAGAPVLVHNFTTAAGCTVIDKEKELTKPQPKVEPSPGRRIPVNVAKQQAIDCGKGTLPADQPVNDPMENFTYLGEPAQRATAGTTCITKSIPREGRPDTPVGFTNGDEMHRGHLIAARFSGTNNVINIVPMYIYVNTPIMRSKELIIAKALKGGSQSIVYRVWVQYPSKTAALPQWIFMEATGSNGFECFVTIENVPGGGRVDPEGC